MFNLFYFDFTTFTTKQQNSGGSYWKGVRDVYKYLKEFLYMYVYMCVCI